MRRADSRSNAKPLAGGEHQFNHVIASLGSTIELNLGKTGLRRPSRFWC